VANFCPHCGAALTRPPSRVGPGSELELDGWGKAVLQERIGEGGMGIVYGGWLYYDPQGPRAHLSPHPVAVKALNPLLTGRERARRLFLGEAAALERLNHPNIVRFYALAQPAGQLAIVMELVEGQPLSDVIDAYASESQTSGLPCMPFMHAWHYFSQLLGALGAIHALGIIHRDIKPSNVLVRTDGVVKLTDFGIARVPADEVRNTGGLAPGTGAYMSPEQVFGRELDPRADLYGAAVVLYEMLSGTTPFEGPGRNEIMVRTAQVEESPPPLRRAVPQAPSVLEVLMARALAKDPALRFGSAIELGEAFRDALDLPKTVGWRAQQKFAKNARAISGALAASGSLPAGEAEKLRTQLMNAYQRESGAP
jgi:serine/threonine-protein kinase